MSQEEPGHDITEEVPPEEKETEEETYRCPLCGKEFKTERGLKIHMAKAHVDLTGSKEEEQEEEETGEEEEEEYPIEPGEEKGGLAKFYLPVGQLCFRMDSFTQTLLGLAKTLIDRATGRDNSLDDVLSFIIHDWAVKIAGIYLVVRRVRPVAEESGKEEGEASSSAG